MKKLDFITNVFFWGTIAVLLVLFFRYLLPPVLPFLLGFAVASVFNPLITKLSRVRRRGFSSVVVILPFWGIVLFLLWKLCALFYGEVIDLLRWIQTTNFNEILSSIHLPFLEKDTLQWITEKADDLLPTLINLSQSVLKRLMNIVMALPDAFLFCFMTVVSSLLFSICYPKIEPFVLRQLPARLQTEYYDIKEFLFRKIFRIFRAHGVMLLINFTALLIGFLILKTPYPLIFAGVIALFDLLPFIGIASIIVPWGLVEWLVLSNPTQGIGLVVLAVIVSLAREFLEPRIVGKNIGLSPLATLFSVYLGMKWLGVFGIFLFPLVFLFLKEWNASGRIFLWKNQPD